MARVSTLILAAWALGLVLGEALLQAAAGAALLAAAVLGVRGRLRLAPDVARYAAACVALAAWQALSPALALATGTAERWPRSARYGQVLDTVAGAAVAALGSQGVRWGLLAALVAGGWLAAAALGLYQHRVRWPWTPPGFLKLQVWRLHENFGTEAQPRYAAGGFLFHRLRFAHGAVAALGPALVLAARAAGGRRVLAGAVVLCLLASIFMAFARAALGAALLVCALALALLWKGRPRRVGAVLAVGLLVAAALTPAWRERAVRGVENLFGGERTVAMAAGWRLVREHPLLGVGFGNHQRAALAHPANAGLGERLALDSHNLWLTVWAETGLVGLVLLLAVHGLLARALVRRHRAGSLAGTGALLSLAGFHLLALVHYLPFHSSVHLSFALVWGLGLCEGSEVLAARQGEAPAQADGGERGGRREATSTQPRRAQPTSAKGRSPIAR